VLWFMSTRRRCKIPVVSNSHDQLRDTIWPEIGQWHRRLPEELRARFDIQKERIILTADPDAAFAVPHTASKDNPEALQWRDEEDGDLYVQKQTTELSAGDCRNLKNACAHARELGRPLNTLVTFAPYPGSKPPPAARSTDLNRLRTYLDTWIRRHHGEPLIALHVWHSDVTGRNPHVHVFMHCPHRLRNELEHALVALYPAGVIDVREGGDIRTQHRSGYWGSTLDYLCRFKSQQAWWADCGKTYRASIRDEKGRHRGIKSPITGKRWGCTRNISPRAIELHLEAKAEAREAARSTSKAA
jgi:hypothetical protein